MKYDVTIGDRVLTFEVPRLEFDPPVDEAPIQAVVAAVVAHTVEPHLRDTLRWTRFERNASGQVERIVKVPAMTAAQHAEGIGRQVAERYMDGLGAGES